MSNITPFPFERTLEGRVDNEVSEILHDFIVALIMRGYDPKDQRFIQACARMLYPIQFLIHLKMDLEHPGLDVMDSNFHKVIEFMQVFGQEVKDYPEFPDNTTCNLRLKLIREELRELEDAIEEQDLVEVADALTDLLYVVYGAGCAFGIDLDACFNEVHSSNMSKLDEDGNPIYREDGKVMKGPNFFHPDLSGVLFSGDEE